MQKLFDLGFDQAAVAHLKNGASDGLVITTSKYALAKNLLYAVVLNKDKDQELDSWQVRYIGHTRKSFSSRMMGYQAGNGKAVNNRVHLAMKNHLRTGGGVIIYVLPDKLSLSMHDLHVDVAAGLEYALIKYYCDYNCDVHHLPLLNVAGNTNFVVAGDPGCSITADLIDEAADRAEGDDGASVGGSVMPVSTQVNPLCRFEIKLTERVFWPIPVFNVKVACAAHFGPDGDVVKVDLVDRQNTATTLSVPINRTANANHTPRLYFADLAGKAYTLWKKAFFKVNDTVVVYVVGHNHIRLYA